MHNKHIILCTGGQLGHWALPFLQLGELCIGADKGALFLVEAGIKPYLSIGDFDSVTVDQLNIIRTNSKHIKDFDAIDKDYTDTELALHEAIALKPRKITILGGLGTRFDHSLANIQLLKLTDDLGIDAEIIDSKNKIRLVSRHTKLSKDDYSFISLLPFTDCVEGITLKGFQYPLTDATIRKGQAIGVSNIIVEQDATIDVKQGTLLVIHSND